MNIRAAAKDMKAHIFLPKVRDQLQTTGFAVLRQAFPRAQILDLGKRMEAELERLAAIRDSLPDDMKKSIDRSEMPAHEALARFRLEPSNYSHLVESQTLRTTLDAVFGETYFWHYPTMFRKISPHVKDGFLPFHQDYSYNSHYGHLVTCWVPFSDCGADAPSISVIAANVDVKFEHVPNGKWESGISQEKLRECLANAPVVDLECSAGDAVLFGELTLHRTCFRTGMTRPRLSMDARAVALSSIPAEARRKRKFVASDRPELVMVGV